MAERPLHWTPLVQELLSSGQKVFSLIGLEDIQLKRCVDIDCLCTKFTSSPHLGNQVQAE